MWSLSRIRWFTELLDDRPREKEFGKLNTRISLLLLYIFIITIIYLFLVLKVPISSHFASAEPIDKAMQRLIAPLNLNAVAKKGLCTFTFYATSDGQTLISLGYNRKLAPGFNDFAQQAAAATGGSIIGRGPKGERIVVGPGRLVEWFEVESRLYFCPNPQ